MFTRGRTGYVCWWRLNCALHTFICNVESLRGREVCQGSEMFWIMQTAASPAPFWSWGSETCTVVVKVRICNMPFDFIFLNLSYFQNYWKLRVSMFIFNFALFFFFPSFSGKAIIKCSLVNVAELGLKKREDNHCFLHWWRTSIQVYNQMCCYCLTGKKAAAHLRQYCRQV